MFVHQSKEQKEDRDIHFASFAKRFALDAKVFRCRAAVHVEDKDDIVFWNLIFQHYLPDEKFHFISGSRNEYGNRTSGVTQCLKYFNYLSNDFIICIDSDYRYLLRQKEYSPSNFVLQTYTYSFENHHCYAKALNDACERTVKLNNNIFNFQLYLKRYSNIIYRLFIWHLYFLTANETYFSKSEFNSYLIPREIINSNKFLQHIDVILDELQEKINKKVNYFKAKFPKADMSTAMHRFVELGINEDNVYFFVRGHNIYDMMLAICKEVCRQLIINNRQRKKTESIDLIYKRKGGIESAIRQNICYDEYIPIRLLGKDINELFVKKRKK